MSRLDLRKGQFFTSSYRDFEGMADGKKVLMKCRDPHGTHVGPTYQGGKIIDPTVKEVHPPGRWAWDIACMGDDSPELKQAVRSITLNICYEIVDVTDEESLTYDTVLNTALTVREMLTCPEWVEVTDADIEAILNTPDEE